MGETPVKTNRIKNEGIRLINDILRFLKNSKTVINIRIEPAPIERYQFLSSFCLLWISPDNGPARVTCQSEGSPPAILDSESRNVSIDCVPRYFKIPCIVVVV